MCGACSTVVDILRDRRRRTFFFPPQTNFFFVDRQASSKRLFVVSGVGKVRVAVWLLGIAGASRGLAVLCA